MPLDNPPIQPLRKVGAGTIYTGSDGASQGFYVDYDGYWVYLTLNAFRTIGNVSSGAAIAATWTFVLFEHLWNQYAQTRCPVITATGGASSRGASAIADYAANKRITLPDERGRVFAGAGTGSSLTARTQHTQVGEEAHTQTIAEMPSHAHNNNVAGGVTGTAPRFTFVANDGSPLTQTLNAGQGTAFNVIQPTTFEHFLIAAGAR